MGKLGNLALNWVNYFELVKSTLNSIEIITEILNAGFLSLEIYTCKYLIENS